MFVLYTIYFYIIYTGGYGKHLFYIFDNYLKKDVVSNVLKYLNRLENRF